MPLFAFKMAPERIANIKDAVLKQGEQGEQGEHEEAWRLARPLLKAARRVETARALSELTRRGAFALEDGLAAAQVLADAHPADVQVIKTQTIDTRADPGRGRQLKAEWLTQPCQIRPDIDIKL